MELFSYLVIKGMCFHILRLGLLTSAGKKCPGLEYWPSVEQEVLRIGGFNMKEVLYT
jgi:hypothetical protein